MTRRKREEKNEQYKARKLGDSHASLSEARAAISEAISAAKKKNQPVSLGICIALLHLCEAINTIRSDMELTQVRVTTALRQLSEQPPVDDYTAKRR